MSGPQIDRPRSDRDADEDSASRPKSLSRDDAFHLLQNARRRAVLRYLLSHDTQNRFVMRDLADVITAWECDTTVDEITSAQRQRVYISLYQSHLPKLDDLGVIEYDQSRGIVTRQPLVAALSPYLEDGLDVSETLEVIDGESGAGTGRGKGLLEKFGLSSR